jgi:hypothetical protein
MHPRGLSAGIQDHMFDHDNQAAERGARAVGRKP